jgi:hypothetical protein|tara:strand:+ start:446 stop:871 length:426 start_codon:yes stop_codon:yes gene_type:complete
MAENKAVEVREAELTQINIVELKSVEDESSPIKAEDVKVMGEKIVKMFPNGVNLQNMIEATIVVLKEVSVLYKLEPQHKIDLIVDILIYTIDNTDAGSLEVLDPILKQLIPGVIDNMLKVDEGKLVLHKKNFAEKYLCCKK